MIFSDYLEKHGVDPQKTVLVRHPYSQAVVKYLYEGDYLDLSVALQNKGKFDRYDYIMSFLGFPDETCLFLQGYLITGYQLDAHRFLKDYPYQEHITDQSVFYTLSPQLELEKYQNRLLIHWGKGQRIWLQRGMNVKPILNEYEEPIDPDKYLAGLTQ